MLVRVVIFASFLVICSTPAVVAQDASAVVGAASKAMGTDNLNAIAYIGRARMGAFGQSKSIGDPMGAVNVTSVADYRRVINFSKPDTMTAPVSRATGTTHPPMVPGASLPTPGPLNQTITAAQAAGQLGDRRLNIWATPWGFLKAAACQQRDGKAARQPAGRLVFSCGLHVALRLELHSDRVHQQSESGHQSRDARRSCGCRRPSGRVRIFGLPEHERPAGADSRRAAAGGSRRHSMRAIESATANPPTLAELLAPPPAGAAPRPPLLSLHRRRRLSSASETGSSRSAETTPRSPSTWAITCSSSKAGRAMRAGWR